MRLLFSIDMKNYRKDGITRVRNSVRGIIIRDNQIAMIHSRRFDYYKVPGGGIENNETHYGALYRELIEETGMVVDENTIKPYGTIFFKGRGSHEDLFSLCHFLYG